MKTLNEFINFGKKKSKEPEISEPKRFPDRHETKDWIEHTVAYHRKYHPKEAHRLFDPHSGDYLPNAIQVGHAFTGSSVKAYHEAREKHHDLVKRAMDENKDGGPRAFISRVNGHPDDFKHLG